MVAAILSLKWRTMLHQLRREWWRVLVLVLGVVWSLSLIPTLFWMRFNLFWAPSEARTTALVLVALLLSIGWVVVPVLITGLDDTLDPGRFASLGVEARRLMPGLTVAQFLTVPALFSVLVLVVLSTVWWRPRWVGYAPGLLSAVGALLSVAVMVLAARVAVMWVARVLASRRGRALAGIGLIAGVAGVIALAIGVMTQGLETVLEYAVPALVSGVGSTPLGAGMAVGAPAVQGDWWEVAWRLAMMVAVAWVLHRAWRVGVEHTLVHPVYRGGGMRRRHDTMLAAAERRWHRVSQPTWAVMARQRRYWLSDPRYVVSLAGVVALPVMYLALLMPALGLESRWAYVAPVVLAASIGWGRHNDVAFDSTALWLDVTAGRLGASVMRGRMAAVAQWAAPAVTMAVLAVAVVTGHWALLPGALGAGLGVLGVTLGLSAAMSVLFPYRVPGPGENPFAAEVGSVGASLLAQLVSSLVTLAALPLVALPFALTMLVDPLWGWAALVLGVVAGPLALLGGMRLAGELYDRRSGRLLAAVV